MVRFARSTLAFALALSFLVLGDASQGSSGPGIHVGQPSSLPPGWVRLQAGNGQPYYAHSASGRTQWEPPGSLGSDAVGTSSAAQGEREDQGLRQAQEGQDEGRTSEDGSEEGPVGLPTTPFAPHTQQAHQPDGRAEEGIQVQAAFGGALGGLGQQQQQGTDEREPNVSFNMAPEQGLGHGPGGDNRAAQAGSTPVTGSEGYPGNGPSTQGPWPGQQQEPPMGLGPYGQAALGDEGELTPGREEQGPGAMGSEASWQRERAEEEREKERGEGGEAATSFGGQGTGGSEQQLPHSQGQGRRDQGAPEQPLWGQQPQQQQQQQQQKQLDGERFPERRGAALIPPGRDGLEQQQLPGTGPWQGVQRQEQPREEAQDSRQSLGQQQQWGQGPPSSPQFGSQAQPQPGGGSLPPTGSGLRSEAWGQPMPGPVGKQWGQERQEPSQQGQGGPSQGQGAGRDTRGYQPLQQSAWTGGAPQGSSWPGQQPPQEQQQQQGQPPPHQPWQTQGPGQTQAPGQGGAYGSGYSYGAGGPGYGSAPPPGYGSAPPSGYGNAPPPGYGNTWTGQGQGYGPDSGYYAGALVPEGHLHGSDVREQGLQLVKGAWTKILSGTDKTKGFLSRAKETMVTGASAAGSGIATFTYTAGSKVKNTVGSVSHRMAGALEGETGYEQFDAYAQQQQAAHGHGDHFVGYGASQYGQQYGQEPPRPPQYDGQGPGQPPDEPYGQRPPQGPGGQGPPGQPFPQGPGYGQGGYPPQQQQQQPPPNAWQGGPPPGQVPGQGPGGPGGPGQQGQGEYGQGQWHQYGRPGQ
ncbi:unnamed protein product [Chrysoparadoxa australica]